MVRSPRVLASSLVANNSNLTRLMTFVFAPLSIPQFTLIRGQVVALLSQSL